MALWNQIGPFEFLDLIGGVQLLQEESEILLRAGVDGSGLKLTGRRGRPFRMHSRVDAFTVADAHDAAVNYQAIVNDGLAYFVAHQGIDYTNAGVQFLVLDVSNIRISARKLTMGGIFPPSLGWIEAEWTLLAVPLNL